MALALAVAVAGSARAEAFDATIIPEDEPAVASTPEFPVLQAGADLFKGLFTIATLGGKVTVYGQIAPTFQSVDDGVAGYDAILDNANSQSRIGLLSDIPLAASTVRLRAEFGLGLPKTSQSSQTSDLSYGFWGDTYVRYFEVRLSGDYGILALGQGDMATNDAASNDASKTRVAGGVAIRDSAGGFSFRRADGSLSEVQIGDVFDSFNANRRIRVLYNSRVRNGFSLAAAYGGNKRSESGTQTNYDAAVNYAGSFSETDVNASLGFARQQDEAGMGDGSYVGSVAVLHKPTGMNLSLASGGRSGGARYGYVKIGWTGDPLRTGFTAIAAEYYDGQDFETSGTASTARGLMAVQGFDDLGLEAYVAYRDYAFSDPSDGPYRDIRSVLVGARWKF
ncbi:hypothetical protein ACRDNQ_01430 [Palleronia sp. KMU-117]|uniref:hypothetical protein n=1 Tax=Palleronia sp. KMU-117 TaxID=3434108 RepID=UPI003D705345